MVIVWGRDRAQCKGQQNVEREITFSAPKEFQITEPDKRKFKT
jgi:hypothetical protein